MVVLDRLRGYKNDSIFTKAGEEEAYYKQPGHPLHPLAEKGGRYTVRSLTTDREAPSSFFFPLDSKGY